MEACYTEITTFLDDKGRLTKFPARRKKKLYALAYLADKLESGVNYTESQINDLLDGWHTFHDPATLRRELYNLRFLDRTPDGRLYAKADPQPSLEALEKRFG